MNKQTNCMVIHESKTAALLPSNLAIFSFSTALHDNRCYVNNASSFYARQKSHVFLNKEVRT